MYCSIEEGSEPLFFEWSKNGQIIRPAPDVKYRIDNLKLSSGLTIEKVARSDAGNYSCLVKNGVGSDSKNVLLNVKGNSYFSFILVDILNRSVAQCLPLIVS